MNDMQAVIYYRGLFWSVMLVFAMAGLGTMQAAEPQPRIITEIVPYGCSEIYAEYASRYPEYRIEWVMKHYMKMIGRCEK